MGKSREDDLFIKKVGGKIRTLRQGRMRHVLKNIA